MTPSLVSFPVDLAAGSDVSGMFACSFHCGLILVDQTIERGLAKATSSILRKSTNS